MPRVTVLDDHAPRDEAWFERHPAAYLSELLAARIRPQVWAQRPARALQGVALVSGGAFAALAVSVALAARRAFVRWRRRPRGCRRRSRPWGGGSGGVAATHPSGRMVVDDQTQPYPGPGRVEYRQPYRGQTLAIVAPP